MEAVTGVAKNFYLPGLADEKNANTVINLDFEDHCRICVADTHEFCYESQGSDMYLIGSWKKNELGLWTPDTQGEYSATVNSTHTRVWWSRYTCFCRPCQFQPDVGDLGESGGIYTYDLPTRVWGRIQGDF